MSGRLCFVGERSTFQMAEDENGLEHKIAELVEKALSKHLRDTAGREGASSGGESKR